MMREILEKLSKGEVSLEEAEKLLKISALEELGEIAKPDVARESRAGIPEVVLAEGKEPTDLVRIVEKLLDKVGKAVISRVSDSHVKALKGSFKDVVFKLNKRARVVVVRKRGFKLKRRGGRIGILAAGTADIPVAEEARVMAEEMGCCVLRSYDVGVAGIHRLFPHLRDMIDQDVDVIIVVAGMEGALPSVVAGLVDVPVIGVPTSQGYGLGGKGVGALITMLQSCSLGLAVVNIDNGIGAGALAALISNRIASARSGSHA